MDKGRRSGGIEKKRSKRIVEKSKLCWNVEHSIIAVGSSPHSPSFSECEEGKAYNEKMQFAHTIIEDIYKFETYAVEFLCICRKGCWNSSEQAKPRATLVDLMNIEKSKENKGVE
jgi:hypothetical protein